jgi:hypothetical protein
VGILDNTPDADNDPGDPFELADAIDRRKRERGDGFGFPDDWDIVNEVEKSDPWGLFGRFQNASSLNDDNEEN